MVFYGDLLKYFEEYRFCATDCSSGSRGSHGGHGPRGSNFAPFAYENMYHSRPLVPPGPRHRAMTKYFAPWPPHLNPGSATVQPRT